MWNNDFQLWHKKTWSDQNLKAEKEKKKVNEKVKKIFLLLAQTELTL